MRVQLVRDPGSAAPAPHRIELRIRNRAQDLVQVHEAMQSLAARAGIPGDAAIDMNVALDEVLSNLISYGYRDEASHDIVLVLSAGGGLVEALVEDDGVEFDPLAAPAPDLQAPIEAWPVGGLGIHLVRNLMTEVRYERLAGRNRLHMVRRFGEEGAP